MKENTEEIKQLDKLLKKYTYKKIDLLKAMPSGYKVYSFVRYLMNKYANELIDKKILIYVNGRKYYNLEEFGKLAKKDIKELENITIKHIK